MLLFNYPPPLLQDMSNKNPVLSEADLIRAIAVTVMVVPALLACFKARLFADN